VKRRISSGWELELLQRHIDELFDLLASPVPVSSTAWSPAVDVLEFPDRFVVRADLPGVAAGDIELHVHERELHLTGTKRMHAGPSSSPRCHLIERAVGPFEVEILLPGPVCPDDSRATLGAGVLEVHLNRVTDRRNAAHPLAIAVEEP
jgi:HSP20 family protein